MLLKRISGIHQGHTETIRSIMERLQHFISIKYIIASIHSNTCITFLSLFGKEATPWAQDLNMVSSSNHDQESRSASSNYTHMHPSATGFQVNTDAKTGHSAERACVCITAEHAVQHVTTQPTLTFCKLSVLLHNTSLDLCDSLHYCTHIPYWQLDDTWLPLTAHCCMCCSIIG